MPSWSSCHLGEPEAVGTHALPGEAAAPRAAHQAIGWQGWQDSWCGVLALHSPACYSAYVSAVPSPGGLGALGQDCSSPSTLGPTKIPQTCAKHLCQEHLCGVHPWDFHELFTSSGSDNTRGSTTFLCPCPRHVPMLTRRAGLCLPLLTYVTAWIQLISWYLFC